MDGAWCGGALDRVGAGGGEGCGVRGVRGLGGGARGIWEGEARGERWGRRAGGCLIGAVPAIGCCGVGAVRWGSALLVTDSGAWRWGGGGQWVAGRGKPVLAETGASPSAGVCAGG